MMIGVLTQTRSTLSLALLLGGLSAVGPLSLDMYLPGLPALGSDLAASASATIAAMPSRTRAASQGSSVSGLSNATGSNSTKRA